MIGRTISHYRITAKLGEGGMGAVYRGEDEKLQRAVALKFLPADIASDSKARERLLKEARAASRLNHPNIATIYEVGEHEGTSFIAMELVRGESLKETLLRGALPAPQLLEVARQIAEGLNEAHQAGVFHRDIKPGNIMLDAKRRVKILDFGVAVLARGERGRDETTENFISRTATQWSTGGTVPYMAPEQLRGEPADARSDLFSYGVLLYECLSGRLPFRGETSIDILHAILREPPIPLRHYLPEVSAEWEQLVERCLEKEPERRFASLQEVLHALRRAAAPATVAEKSVAVLYFENLSAGKEDEYFRDGITEDVITELSKIKPLRVFPRSAVLAYRDKPATAPEIGRQLNAAFVLGGSLRRAGNRVRITAQLVETRTGHSVWAERYDRQMEDIFAIQDEIAQNIAQALQVMLTEKEKRAIEQVPTVHVKAYDYYLRGRQFFHQFRQRGFQFARQMFTRATEIDPRYAGAYAGIADCSSFLYMYWDGTEANLKQADEASRKALELDPESAEGHASRGLALSLTKQFDEAQVEFETAIRVNPNLFEAYYFYARACFVQGKLGDAARLFEQASRLRPEDYQAPNLLGLSYQGLGRKAEAAAAYRRCIQVLEKHLELHPDDARGLYLGGQAASQLGERERALDWAERALVLDSEDPAILYNVGCVFALQGETERALDCIEKSLDYGFGYREWMGSDAFLNSLRNHPRFQELVKGK